jgi:hypothetical protein
LCRPRHWEAAFPASLYIANEHLRSLDREVAGNHDIARNGAADQLGMCQQRCGEQRDEQLRNDKSDRVLQKMHDWALEELTCIISLKNEEAERGRT